MFNKKKLLCLLLALVMVLPLFAACNKHEGKPVDIVKDGASDYTVIYSKSKSATADKAAATKLRDAIKDATGVKLDLDTDWLPESSTEILVGQTSRAATKDALTLIREKDFIIAYKDGTVIITGGNDAATARGVDYFIENYINTKKEKVTVYDGGDYIGQFEYMLGDLTVSGVSLSEYTIVYPKDADKTDKITYYIAVNLYDYILNNAGIKMKMVSDATAETEYEILVGKTNRQQSQAVADTELAADEYLLFANGKKIVMMGNSYMLGGAASALMNKYFASKGANQAIDAVLPTAATPAKFTFEKATSALLLIGDGMGFNHVKAGVEAGQAAIAAGASAEKCMSEFVAELLPYKTSCVTASQSVINGTADYTDSAAAATALATGHKTINYYVGLDANKQRVQNIRELAQSVGAKTAVLTTATITDATPAGFLAHANDRNDTEDIQAQIDKLIAEGKVDYVKGDTNNRDNVNENNLIVNAREALSVVSENNSRFFAMIEEAHIDKFSHQVKVGAETLADVQNSVICYNEVIAYAIGFTMMHPATALIITADHECGSVTIDPEDGSFHFNSDNHTNSKVPYYGLGDGIEELIGSKTEVDNTDTPKFIAKIFGDNNFGG
ncbi:MAG: alkaline phosphatase [Clostridia bacterium]|nr:alkaline phosphatase [Clostridia bacterium]